MIFSERKIKKFFSEFLGICLENRFLVVPTFAQNLGNLLQRLDLRLRRPLDEIVELVALEPEEHEVGGGGDGELGEVEEHGGESAGAEDGASDHHDEGGADLPGDHLGIVDGLLDGDALVESLRPLTEDRLVDLLAHGHVEEILELACVVDPLARKEPDEAQVEYTRAEEDPEFLLYAVGVELVYVSLEPRRGLVGRFGVVVGLGDEVHGPEEVGYGEEGRGVDEGDAAEDERVFFVHFEHVDHFAKISAHFSNFKTSFF